MLAYSVGDGCLHEVQSCTKLDWLVMQCSAIIICTLCHPELHLYHVGPCNMSSLHPDQMTLAFCAIVSMHAHGALPNEAGNAY